LRKRSSPCPLPLEVLASSRLWGPMSRTPPSCKWSSRSIDAWKWIPVLNCYILQS
jgi:hypothetical protein